MNEQVPTVDALLRTVQRHLTEEFDDRLLAFIAAAQGRHASIVDACCDFLEELLGPRRGEFLAAVELGVAAGPVPLIRSLMTSCLGGEPDGGTTAGLVFNAAGSGVLLVLVALAEVEVLAVGVTAAAV